MMEKLLLEIGARGPRKGKSTHRSSSSTSWFLCSLPRPDRPAAMAAWQQLSSLLVAATALLLTTRLLVVSALSDVPGTITFDEGFTPLFGEANMERSPDGRTVSLTLNRYSGSGFISSHYYHHGFFSADIRLPKDHTAGVVVAFYVRSSSLTFFLNYYYISPLLQ